MSLSRLALRRCHPPMAASASAGRSRWDTAFALEPHRQPRAVAIGRASTGTRKRFYRLARNIDWLHLFSARETIRVQVDAIRSPLTSL